MRVSLLYPIMPTEGYAARPYADLVKHGSAERLWMGTSVGTEAHQNLAFLAGAGYTIPVGTSVMLTPLRHPFEAAAAARSLALLTGQPVVAGFGASSPALVTRLLGAPYRYPAATVRDYLSRVKAFLHHHETGLPPVEHPTVEVGAGVLRPGMARAAGGVADVAITWMTPPGYLSGTLLPALRTGAGDDREPPRVATVVHVAVSRPGREFSRLAYLAAHGHLRAPHYVDMLRRAGLDVNADDPVTGARRLVENGVFVTGTQERIVAELGRYESAGVDELILNTAGVLAAHGRDAAVADASEILAAMEAGTQA